MKKLLSALASLVFLIPLTLFASIAPAQAANCNSAPANSFGPTVGVIHYKNLSVGVKSVTYPAGGILVPPATTLFAGLSARHNPLSATEGTSIVIWHVDYNMCIGKLDPLKTAQVGESILVTDEHGTSHHYIVYRTLVKPHGNYDKSWFLLNGPRTIIFVTCTGAFANGHHKENAIIFAKPA